jgi:hypothetical protein
LAIASLAYLNFTKTFDRILGLSFYAFKLHWQHYPYF